MGGYGSGRWYRHNVKQTVEASLCLDISRLRKAGFLKSGELTTAKYTWRYSKTREVTAQVDLTANLRNSECPFIELDYIHGKKRERMKYRVNLARTYPNYGGIRYWFVCPISGNKTKKLYLPSGKRIFASRNAHNLVYHSQREDSHGRVVRKMYDLIDKLGGRQNYIFKPKGMHTDTYRDLIGEIQFLEKQSLNLLCKNWYAE